MHHAHARKYPITGGRRPVGTALDERDKDYVQVAERFSYKDLQPQMYAAERKKEKRIGLTLILDWLERHGPAISSDIADALEVTPSAIQYHLTRSSDKFIVCGIAPGPGSPKLWGVAK